MTLTVGNIFSDIFISLLGGCFTLVIHVPEDVSYVWRHNISMLKPCTMAYKLCCKGQTFLSWLSINFVNKEVK